MNPDSYGRTRHVCHNTMAMENTRQAARAINKQAEELQAKLKAEPGRANAPAVCRCQHSLLSAGCQCPGYVDYKTRTRGW